MNKDKWDKISFEMSKELPFLAACLIDRPIRTDGSVIYLMFKKSEETLAKIADFYLNQIQEQFDRTADCHEYKLEILKNVPY